MGQGRERTSWRTTERHPSKMSIRLGGRMLEAMGYSFPSIRTWGKQGAPYVDDNRLLDARGALLQELSGEALLTAGIREQFRPLQRVGVSGKPYLSTVFGGSAGQRILFVVGWDSREIRMPGLGGLITFDIPSQRSLPALVAPYSMAPSELTLGTPTVHLSPDGKLIIIEKYEWKPATNKSDLIERFKTGEIAVYAADTGALLRIVQMTPAPGFFSYVVGFSPTNDFLGVTDMF